VPVTVEGPEGKKTVTVNQKPRRRWTRRFVSLGTYRFTVESAGGGDREQRGTNGYVIIDAVQVLAVK